MQLTWQKNQHPHHIIAADADGMLIGDQRHRTSLLVDHEQLITDWSVTTSSHLDHASLQPLLDASPEVLLLGTGRQQIFPDMDLLQGLLRQGIGVEVMDTLAACRTFNILLQEERKVAAALIWEHTS